MLTTILIVLCGIALLCYVCGALGLWLTSPSREIKAGRVKQAERIEYYKIVATLSEADKEFFRRNYALATMKLDDEPTKEPSPSGVIGKSKNIGKSKIDFSVYVPPMAYLRLDPELSQADRHMQLSLEASQKAIDYMVSKCERKQEAEVMADTYLCTICGSWGLKSACKMCQSSLTVKHTYSREGIGYDWTMDNPQGDQQEALH